jgi:aryl-alcohol dehydrogenase-like predicted oxidoreductase
MKYRPFGKTGRQISEIGFGAWAIGGSWGDVDEADAVAALRAALDDGVNFIDTADVYGDGRSEQIIARVLKGRSGPRPFVATKAGRRLNPHLAKEYTAKNIEAFVERSLRNLQTDALDLLQLHCPPTEVYYMPELFDALDRLIKRGTLKHYGVSVEKIEEALKAIEYPNVLSVQIIYNMFRMRPAELFLKQAKRREVAVIARVPLASGLLTGKMSRNSRFGDNDHRQFNRHGEAFDVGETFSGVPFEKGLLAVDELRKLVPDGITMTQFALRWILMNDAITVAIPGAKNAAQAHANSGASGVSELGDATMQKIAEIYTRLIKPDVHHRW